MPWRFVWLPHRRGIDHITTNKFDVTATILDELLIIITIGGGGCNLIVGLFLLHFAEYFVNRRGGRGCDGGGGQWESEFNVQ
jgi:hypothetical protein